MEVMKCDVIPDIFSTCSILSIVCMLYRKVCGSAQCPTQCHHQIKLFTPIIYNYQSIYDHLQLAYDVIPDF